jgi:hypothetical protein
MDQMRPKRRMSSAGASLIELLVVMAVMAILMSLILVAIQRSREAARRAMCQSNLRQIGIAMGRYIELRKHVPNAAPMGQVGGWPIELMPFLEETQLGDQLLSSPSLSPGAFSPLIRQRPTILTCPSGYEGDSELDGVPVAHYIVGVRRKPSGPRSHATDYSLGHAREDCRIPWPACPEYDPVDFPNGYAPEHPHTIKYGD